MRFDIEVLLDKEKLESELELKIATVAYFRIMLSSPKDEVYRGVGDKLSDLIVDYKNEKSSGHKIIDIITPEINIATELEEEIFLNGKKIKPSSLEVRAKRAAKTLSKQGHITLEMAREQVAWLKAKKGIRRKRY